MNCIVTVKCEDGSYYAECCCGNRTDQNYLSEDGAVSGFEKQFGSEECKGGVISSALFD